MFFLDGHNNPGFSGGPIVYRDLNLRQVAGFYVAAVVSGYRPEYDPVLQPQELKPGEPIKPEDEERIVPRSDGKKLKLVETVFAAEHRHRTRLSHQVRPGVDS